MQRPGAGGSQRVASHLYVVPAPRRLLGPVQILTMSSPTAKDDVKSQGREWTPLRSRVVSSHRGNVRAWWVFLLAASLAGAFWIGFAPLADPDLPMHLAIGEWIAGHGAVPFVEPFAWTRLGEPYFAYSWLPELAFFVTLRVGGPLGLHLLAAAAGAGIVLAGALVGRALGLRPLGAMTLGALNMWFAVQSTPFLRPQLLMYVLVPFAWVCAANVSPPRVRHRAAALVVLFALSALAAGTHISFPAIAMVLALPAIAAISSRSWRILLAPLMAVLLGWLASPYGAVWPEVFRLNFAANALVGGNSPVGELGPGFRVSPAAGLLLGLLPFAARLEDFDSLDKIIFGLLWLAGLLVFAVYFKGLGPWWWCAIPLTVSALQRLPVPSTHRIAIVFALIPAAALFAFSITNVRLYRALHTNEGSLEDRTLPSLKAFASDPAARWLRANLTGNAEGRLLTTFSYGSYLRWRVPSLSESIDSRNIFPDSAALPDVPSLRVRAATGPWQSADVAVVPVTFPVASILDTAAGWQRVGVSAPSAWAREAPRAGLWVRREWFARNGRAKASLPYGPLELR